MAVGVRHGEAWSSDLLVTALDCGIIWRGAPKVIVVADGSRFRGGDVNVAFREIWRGAKDSGTYSDQRGEFIANAMRAMATDACASAAPDAEPDVVRLSVEALMRRVEVEELNTPCHLLALGRLLGRYAISDESPRDARALDQAGEQLRTAWWSSGLDPAAVQPRS